MESLDAWCARGCLTGGEDCAEDCRAGSASKALEEVECTDAAKGFGFVIPSDGGSDIYVHLKALQKAGLETLDPGSSVNFSIASRGGKNFVEEIVVTAAPAPAPAPVPERSQPQKAKGKTPLLDDEELFEREWGLRRA